MTRAFLLLLCVPFLSTTMSAADSTETTHWFPGRLAVLPLVAAPEEPSFSLDQELGTTLLRIGLGNAVDIVSFTTGGRTLRVGGEVYAYALSTDVEDVKFKIDAVDGFFGIRVSLSGTGPWEYRLRALHLSAHLVDGNFDIQNDRWRPGKSPIPFSRNYGEFVLARNDAMGTMSVRSYGGFSIAVYNNPADFKPFTAMAGVEAATAGPPVLYGALHLQLAGTPVYSGTTTAQCGIKFGGWGANGIRLFLRWTNGLNTFGQYYNQRITRWSVGAAFDFWR